MAYAREDYHEASRRWVDALTRSAASDPELLLWLSRAEEVVGEWRQALTHSRDAGRLFLERSDAGLAIDALNASSLSARRLGALAQAESSARQAHALAQTLGGDGRMADSLLNLGALKLEADEPGAALESFEQARQHAQLSGDPLRLARAMNEIGGAQRVRGVYAAAERSYTEALRLATSAGSRLLRARIHGNLCSLYQTLASAAQPEKRRGAGGSCATALSLAREIGALPVVANVLNTRGALRLERAASRGPLLGLLRGLDLYRALGDFERSAEIKSELGDRAGQARSLNNIGEVQLQRGRFAAAERALAESLSIKREVGDLSGQAATLGSLGRLERVRGDLQRARERHREALAIQLTLDEPEMLWRSWDNLSLAHAAEGDSATAIYLGKRAVDVLQQIRAQSSDLEPALRRSYVGRRTDVYRRLAELLIDSDRLLEAEQILTLLKQEEYEGLRVRSGLDERGPARPSLNDGELRQQARYLELTQQVVALGRELAALNQSFNAGLLDDPGKARRRAVLDQLREAQAGFDRFLAALRDELPPGLATLPADELATLSSFQITLERLDDHVAAVYWLPGEDRVRIVATSNRPDQVPPIHRDSPVSLAQLRRWIVEYRSLLRQPGADPRPLAKQLYDALVAPIAPFLDQLETRTVLGYLDRELRYIPFAALHDGERYVAERWAFVVYTPATRDRLAEPIPTAWSVAALGASQARPGFPPLPAVARELDAIVRSGTSDPRGSLPGIDQLDESFTRESLSRALGAGYPVIHLASHFRFGLGRDSFLLLGDGDVLEIADLDPFEFPMRSVELLTLSACETGLGESATGGAEVESFAVSAQKMGAKSVMATLWSVSDQSTGDFMEKFYALHETYKLSKAESLRMTQELFIRGKLVAPDGATVTLRGVEPVDVPDSRSPYSHPFFWSPFTLSGNWL